MSRASVSEWLKLSRRQFVRSCAAGCAIAGTGGILSDSILGESDRSGPIDCGPPPPPQRQHRTGGESFPPLPLPVTPLRRTEKKRPPAPPALIGKMAMGPIKFITQNGKQVKYRDWFTDPADMTNLLAWTRDKLDINYRSVEVDSAHFSYDPRELPALLLTGHDDFQFDDTVRSQLNRYVLDGGMILGDACCGWQNFDEAFRREMAAIFPDRPLRKLAPDDSIFASYYKLDQFSYQKEDGSTSFDAPCLEGIPFGCRLGVVYSPIDLTCGWDGHDHPRGLRVVISQARQIGANYITYLLGNFQLARFLSTQKVYHEASAPTRDDLVLAQIVHEGDWDPDPSALHNLLKFSRDHSTLEVKFKRADIGLDDPRMPGYPLLYMTGHESFQWDQAAVERLRGYFKAGGMLLADACCGRLAFDTAFRHAILKVFPEQHLEPLPADHPIYHAHYDIGRVEYTPRTQEDFGKMDVPSLEGVSLDGRLAVLYSRFDLGNGWEQFPHPYSYGYSEKDALEIGTNAFVYAVTH
ncbi:MAG: DUF4159 domain-containing protein [Pirellulales bacterium]|nr:DUF4159 domain-containing protein [Pirellulales bacterium]